MDNKTFDAEQLKKLLNAAKVSKASFEADDKKIALKDNHEADVIDAALKEKSESAYIQLAEKIVEKASDQLQEQNKSKNTLKTVFMIFFVTFISVQFIALFFLLCVKAFYASNGLSDTVIITYITSVFVETLGAIAVMIGYAFNSAQEVKILQVLNDTISRFKKFNPNSK